MMKHVSTGLVLAAAALLAMAGCEESSSGPRSRRGDAEYLAALVVANDFCQAWQDRDLAAAEALLTDSLIASMREREIRDALVGPGTVEHVAFELSAGSGSGTRLIFPVRSYTRFLGTTEDRIETIRGRIELVRGDGGIWRVSGFPTPPRGASLDRP